MQVQTTIVYDYCNQFFESEKRILAMQGSTRASKTYNILMFLIIQSISERIKDKTISIVRQTLPALKSTVERDFFEILNKLELYDVSKHNKTDRTYQLGSNMFEFFSCDEEMKVRGRKRHILFVNEANELKYDVWVQLLYRTSEKAIIDYNPSHFLHWIYDEVLTRSESQFRKVTYLDNPFLTKEIIAEIERYKFVDENLWKVYGLGERGANIATIFPNYELIDELPENGNVVYGLDFGFNHPTALTKCVKDGNNLYFQECVYESNLTTNDIVQRISNFVEKSAYLYCDYARPEIIRELQINGFNAINADKSVLEGIKFIKENKIHITKDSLNLIRELNTYKWKQNASNEALEEPLKMNDDLIDSMRYAVYSHFKGINRPLNKGTFGKKRTSTTNEMIKGGKNNYNISIR
jgi:phage terminase large subunit